MVVGACTLRKATSRTALLLGSVPAFLLLLASCTTFRYTRPTYSAQCDTVDSIAVVVDAAVAAWWFPGSTYILSLSGSMKQVLEDAVAATLKDKGYGVRALRHGLTGAFLDTNYLVPVQYDSASEREYRLPPLCVDSARARDVDLYREVLETTHRMLTDTTSPLTDPSRGISDVYSRFGSREGCRYVMVVIHHAFVMDPVVMVGQAIGSALFSTALTGGLLTVTVSQGHLFASTAVLIDAKDNAVLWADFTSLPCLLAPRLFREARSKPDYPREKSSRERIDKWCRKRLLASFPKHGSGLCPRATSAYHTHLHRSIFRPFPVLDPPNTRGSVVLQLRRMIDALTVRERSGGLPDVGACAQSASDGRTVRHLRKQLEPYLSYACAYRLRHRPSLEGEMLLTARVRPDGGVRDACIAQSNLDDAVLHRALIDFVKGWRFEPHDAGKGDATVSWDLSVSTPFVGSRRMIR